MKAQQKKYKGIAVFGAPRSGKMTIAKLFLTSFPGTTHFEGS